MNELSQRSSYAPVTISIHWLTVVVMIGIYASIELHEMIPRSNPLRGAMEDWHIYLGFTLFVLAAFRLAINLRMQAPPITPSPPNWQMLATKVMKIYLYALMLVTPILGWVYLSANEESISWFFVPLPSIAPASESLAEFSEEAHELFGLSGYLFIGVHAAAALYHHYLVRDDTLRRMLPQFLLRR